MVEDRRITLSLLCDGRGNIATSKAVMRGDHNVYREMIVVAIVYIGPLMLHKL